MAESYKVLIKLIGNINPCHNGHKVGDEWLWEGKSPDNLCFAAYNSLYPFALVLSTGGKFPWQDDPNLLTVSCPDPEVVNRFELRRIPEKEGPFENYDLSIKLVGKGFENPCSAGHKVGDDWLWRDEAPAGICASAWRAINYTGLVLKYGGKYPWQQDPDVYTTTCPDPNVRNQFEFRRIPRK